MTLVLSPIAAIMGMIGVISASMFIGLMPSLGAASTEVTGFLGNIQLATLPLFLMMGSFAAVADISEDVYRLAHVLLGRLRGGLALTTIAGCAGFGALTGHSSLRPRSRSGKVALPEMQARGYSCRHFRRACARPKRHLGRGLLPPASGPLILFALLSEASVGQLFVAALMPGLLAVALYLITIAIYVCRRVARIRAAQRGHDREPGRLLAGAVALAGEVALLLFGSVLGGIYLGRLHGHTEASAAVGAFESFLCALFRGKLQGKVFWHVMAGHDRDHGDDLWADFRRADFSFFVGTSVR